jgi:hypothetical protein
MLFFFMPAGRFRGGTFGRDSKAAEFFPWKKNANIL